MGERPLYFFDDSTADASVSSSQQCSIPVYNGFALIVCLPFLFHLMRLPVHCRLTLVRSLNYENLLLNRLELLTGKMPLPFRIGLVSLFQSRNLLTMKRKWRLTTVIGVVVAFINQHPTNDILDYCLPVSGKRLFKNCDVYVNIPVVSRSRC